MIGKELPLFTNQNLKKKILIHLIANKIFFTILTTSKKIVKLNSYNNIKSIEVNKYKFTKKKTHIKFFINISFNKVLFIS